MFCNRHQVGRPRRFLHIVGWTFLGLLLAVLFAFLFAFVVKFLWGLTLVPIFGFKQITYWQAFGLLVLVKLLFGHFGHGQHPGKSHRHWRERNEFSRLEWEQYHQYWHTEGKQSFKEYLQRIQKETNSE